MAAQRIGEYSSELANKVDEILTRALSNGEPVSANSDIFFSLRAALDDFDEKNRRAKKKHNPHFEDDLQQLLRAVELVFFKSNRDAARTDFLLLTWLSLRIETEIVFAKKEKKNQLGKLLAATRRGFSGADSSAISKVDFVGPVREVILHNSTLATDLLWLIDKRSESYSSAEQHSFLFPSWTVSAKVTPEMCKYEAFLQLINLSLFAAFREQAMFGDCALASMLWDRFLRLLQLLDGAERREVILTLLPAISLKPKFIPYTFPLRLAQIVDAETCILVLACFNNSPGDNKEEFFRGFIDHVLPRGTLTVQEAAVWWLVAASLNDSRVVRSILHSISKESLDSQAIRASMPFVLADIRGRFPPVQERLLADDDAVLPPPPSPQHETLSGQASFYPFASLLETSAPPEAEQEKRRQIEAFTWERAASEFSAFEKASTSAAGEGPSRCSAVWRSGCESADAESRRRDEEMKAAKTALVEPRALLEAEQLTAGAARKKISELEQELAQQRSILSKAETRSKALENQITDLEAKAAAAAEAKRKADEQLEAVLRAHEEAKKRLDAFTLLAKKRDMSAFSIEDVGELLIELGLGAHRAKFEAEGIDGTALEDADGRTMQEDLDVESLAERTKLMHAVQLISRIGLVRLTAATIIQQAKEATRNELLVATWGADEVAKWLQEHGIPEATCTSLARAGVNGEVLLNLQQNDLKGFCPKTGERIKIAKLSEKVRERFYAAVQFFAKNPLVSAKAPEEGTPPSATAAAPPSVEPSSAPAAPSPEEPPAEFICTVTQEVMRDPVVASDGFSYERDAIERWFADHNTSPMTGATLEDKTLRPNHTLRSATSSWLEKHGKH